MAILHKTIMTMRNTRNRQRRNYYQNQRRSNYQRRSSLNLGLLPVVALVLVLFLFFKQIIAAIKSVYSLFNGGENEGQDDEDVNEQYAEQYDDHVMNGSYDFSMKKHEHETFADQLFSSMNGCHIYYISVHPVIPLLKQLVSLNELGYDDLEAIYYAYGKRRLSCLGMTAFSGTLRGCVHHELSGTINSSSWTSSGKVYNDFITICDVYNLQ